MEYCEECGRNQVELHHIIFKSQAPYMINVKINFMYLCNEHHTGTEGVHRNKEKNIEYKLKLQKKLFELFDRDYYTERDIQQLLTINLKLAREITKKLKLYEEGYERVDIICRLMGGRLYGK
jgi:hypothetical protein